MKNLPKITNQQSPLRSLFATVMVCCLFFFIGSNFIIFPPHAKCLNHCAGIPGKSQDTPSAPAEEESSESKVSSIEDAFLLEKNYCKGSTTISNAISYPQLGADKLSVIHFKLISPPPEA